MLCSFCKVFLTSGQVLALNQLGNISPFLVETPVFLGIHLQIPVVLRNIQGLAPLYFMSLPHELHTIDILF
jgi:hypothetical protein